MSNVSDVAEEISELRLPFFISYITIGCVFMVFHFRFIMVIHQNRALAKLPAYRVIQHNSIACIINIATQIIAVAFTINQDHMDYTLNSINGAIFQGSWAVEYPMMLILAGNRLLSVASPILVNRFCDIKLANILVALCWAFGAFNFALCMSGQVQTYWSASDPAFLFTEGTFLAKALFCMDFYFAEFVVMASLVCYCILFITLVTKALQRETMRRVKLELPLVLHFGTIFAFTAVVLYFWHHRIGKGDLYGHIFNLVVLLRFCASPILAVITNEAIRKQFFRVRKQEVTTVTVIGSKRTALSPLYM